MRYRAIIMAALLTLAVVPVRAEPACVEGAWDQGVMEAAGWYAVALYGDEFQMALHVAVRDFGIQPNIVTRIYSMARKVPGNSETMQFELAFLDKDGCFRFRNSTFDYDTFLSWFDDGSI